MSDVAFSWGLSFNFILQCNYVQYVYVILERTCCRFLTTAIWIYPASSLLHSYLLVTCQMHLPLKVVLQYCPVPWSQTPNFFDKEDYQMLYENITIFKTVPCVQIRITGLYLFTKTVLRWQYFWTQSVLCIDNLTWQSYRWHVQPLGVTTSRKF